MELNPNVKRVGTISFDDYWNNAFIETFTEMALKADVQIVKSLKVNDFNPDFRTEVTALKHAKLDMVLTTWKPEIALQRMREQNFQASYLCSSDSVEAFLLRSNERALFEGTYYLDWRPSEEFSRKFEARYGSKPLYEAQNSYEIIRALSKASGSGIPNLRLTLSHISYDGVAGKIDFTTSQFPNLARAQLYRIKNGLFEEQ